MATATKESKMKLKPLADRVIVRQVEAEEKTKSGIYLPDAAKEKPTQGKVIAVGPGKLDEKGKLMELGVRNGDIVYYGKYSGTEVEVDGQKFVILRESDLLGVLE
jgi:chaperonin GroES